MGAARMNAKHNSQPMRYRVEKVRLDYSSTADLAKAFRAAGFSKDEAARLAEAATKRPLFV